MINMIKHDKDENKDGMGWVVCGGVGGVVGRGQIQFLAGWRWWREWRKGSGGVEGYRSGEKGDGGVGVDRWRWVEKNKWRTSLM